ncbi:MAG: PAS domain S-box protein [Spirochaetes bacterium]|nr:PAS domain S-box protein [Spirochaetota bacterium]
MDSLKRILFVEDDLKDIELTVNALSKYKLANYIVISRDGVESLDSLYRRGTYAERPEGNPVVILLDLKMPRMDVRQKITAGDLCARTIVSSRDELGMLAQSFNQMSYTIMSVNRHIQHNEAVRNSIFYVAPVGIGMATLDRKIIDINTGAEIIFGFSKKELIGSDIRILYANDEEYGRNNTRLNTNLKQNGKTTAEALMCNKDGSMLNGLISIALLNSQNPSDGVVFIIFIVLANNIICAEYPARSLEMTQEHKGDVNILLSGAMMSSMNHIEMYGQRMTIYPSMKLLYISGYTSDVVYTMALLMKLALIQKLFSIWDLQQRSDMYLMLKVRDIVQH